MSKVKNRMLLVALVLLALALMAGNVAAEGKCDVIGLVFIDDNMNGVWDPGEAGYGGEWQYDDVQETERYVGAIVTVETPSYEKFEIETAAYREPDEHEDVVCSCQDTLVDGELNPNPQRPCAGTWGLNRVVNDTYLTISFVSPEGYVGTSKNPQIYLTGEDTYYVDFGIVPIAAATASGTGGPLPAESAAEAAFEATVAAEPAATTYRMSVGDGLGVPGLVFIDDNRDGVWQPGEAGYGGKMTWVEEDGMQKYVGATVTLISPAYDEYTLTSGAYREPEDWETFTCTPQDLFIDGEWNANPVRPCSGAWGLPGWENETRYEVWLTAPEGYMITSPNPQYYTTGSGQMPVDFGIAPVNSEA
jgi:hypothetical protein